VYFCVLYIVSLCDWAFHNTIDWNPQTKKIHFVCDTTTGYPEIYDGTLIDGIFSGTFTCQGRGGQNFSWNMEKPKPKPPVELPFRGYWKTGTPNQRVVSQGYCNALNTFVSDLPIIRIPNVCYDIKLKVTDWNKTHGTFIEADVGLCTINSICPSGSWCTNHTVMSFRMMTWNDNGKFQLIGPNETLQILVNFKSNSLKFIHMEKVLKEVSIIEDQFFLVLTLWSQGAVEIVH